MLVLAVMAPMYVMAVMAAMAIITVMVIMAVMVKIALFPFDIFGLSERPGPLSSTLISTL